MADRNDKAPSLRQPAFGSSNLFPFQPPQKSIFQTSKQLPPTPGPDIRNPAFTTPRRLEPDYDSSGVENLSSPENNADSEATPDNMGFKSGMAKTSSIVANFLDKRQQKEGPIFKSGRSSPSKSGSLQPFYAHGVEKRRRKNRVDAERRLVIRKESSTSDSEDNDDGKAKGGKSRGVDVAPAGPGALVSLFSFIETHPDLPHILSFYAQLLLNFFLVFLFIYMVYCFWSTIRADVDKRSEEAMVGILAEMAICAQNYRENRCEPGTRMPALETVCNNWDRCMNKDPRALGRAKISAHTFAEIFNSFIEPISYKALFFTVTIVFGCFAISNFAFGFFRNRAHPPPPPSSYMQTPRRNFDGSHDYYWTNPHAPMPSPSKAALEPQTPMRRLEYN